MAAILEGVLKYLKVTEEVVRDNWTFRVVTVYSFGIFMLSTILNGLTVYFGDPIVCDGSSNYTLMTDYCRVHGAYNLDKTVILNTTCFTDEDSVSKLFITCIIIKETT